jgi:hypothetical protein
VIDLQGTVNGSSFQDLGLFLEGLNMAAGANATSNLISNTAWVRGIVLLTQSDQQYDIGIQRVDSAGTIDWISWTTTAQPSTGSSQWRPIIYSGATALVGVSFKFVIKNSSASPNTFARIRVQLLGQ